MDTFKIENERINMTFSKQECIDKLLECYKASGLCLKHCLSMGGAHTAESHLSALIECEEMCQTAVDFLVADSPFAYELCDICARVCDSCAESCAKIDENDLPMKECIKACYECAQACRMMEH